jgi:hypothetical protein
MVEMEGAALLGMEDVPGMEGMEGMREVIMAAVEVEDVGADERAGFRSPF